MMKKLILTSIVVLTAASLSAKKVKFSVDMSGQIISPNGVHLVGDFQTQINMGPDWDPGMIALTQEGSTSIYSTVLTLTAFKKYEYRYVNGDQSYEAEFVPDESRVGYDMVDNRWFYLDSLATDTFKLAPILFGGNAPAGKKLVRLLVDMRLESSVSGDGVRLGTSYQSNPFNPAAARLYSFENGIYEIIDYTTSGKFTYLFYNGKTNSSSETVIGTCVESGKRTLTFLNDTIIPVVCFNSCEACKGVGIKEMNVNTSLPQFFPNPVTSLLTLDLNGSEADDILLTDITGKIMIRAIPGNQTTRLDLSDLSEGIYLLKIKGSGYDMTKKIVVAR